MYMILISWVGIDRLVYYLLLFTTVLLPSLFALYYLDIHTVYAWVLINYLFFHAFLRFRFLDVNTNQWVRSLAIRFLVFPPLPSGGVRFGVSC